MNTVAQAWIPGTSRIVGIGACLLLAIALWYGSLAGHLLIKTRRVIGPTSARAREAVRDLVRVARGYPNLVWTRIVLQYSGAGALFLSLLARDWVWLAVAVMPFTLLWWMRVRTTVPPIALLLGSSTITAIKRHREMKRRINPLRVVSLFEADVPWNSDLTHELALDCFRTRADDDWWIVVTRLMDISPIIAIDAAADTEAVMRETRYALRTGLAQKCLFMTPADGFAPLLDRLLPGTEYERRDLHITTYDHAADAILGMVADASRARRSGTVAGEK